MKAKMIRWILEALWLVDPVEPRWWDLEDPDPVTVIQGMPLAAALRHMRAGA